MAKIEQGRISGLDGMDKHTAGELHGWADWHEVQIKNPDNTDDPNWLQRRADRLRRLAIKKEKALEHKINQD